MIKGKHVRRGAFLSVLALFLVACIVAPPIEGAFASATNAIKGIEVHYYNNDVQDDGVDANNYNFGPDRYAAAVEAVKSGAAVSILDYIAKDFFESIAVDPALCAAIAFDMDERLAFDDKILVDEQNELIGQRANKAHLHFLRKHAYWERVVKLIVERLTSGEKELIEIVGYTSSMYQHHNGLDGNKPSVVVRNSRNSGGHFIQFNLGKLGVVRYRLECGYQPVDIDEYWPVPDKPDIPDNPTPPTPPQPTPDPPEPTPPTPPQPTPTLEPKKDAELQQVPDDTPGKEDIGGSGNHAPLTETTEEADSPSEYNPPAPPQPETPEPEPPADEPPETSDGQSYTDLGEVQQQHSADTVEPAVQDDGVNEGDLGESAVE